MLVMELPLDTWGVHIRGSLLLQISYNTGNAHGTGNKMGQRKCPE